MPAEIRTALGLTFRIESQPYTAIKITFLILRTAHLWRTGPHETRLTASGSVDAASAGFPDADELAMLRAWYAGMPVRKAVERYLPQRLRAGQSARGVLGGIRRRLATVARQANRGFAMHLSGGVSTFADRRGRTIRLSPAAQRVDKEVISKTLKVS